MLRAVTWDVRRFPSLGSTNDWVLAQARSGADEGLVAVADHQVAGRGRLGRRWEAPAGTALLASVLLRPLAPAASLYACTAAVALAAADACRTVAGVAPTIKWPNDLVVPAGAGPGDGEGADACGHEGGGTRKLAGVLADSDAAAPGGRQGSIAVVVGLGLNVSWAPDGATCLADQMAGGASRDIRDRTAAALVEALLLAWLEALGPRVPLLDQKDGRAAVLDELREQCVTLGQEVRVELGGEAAVSGTAVRIDTRGRLVIAAGDGGGVRDAGETSVAAGDVVHLRPGARRPG